MADMLDLLTAYQFLQGQNIHVASALSVRLGLGANDLRVLMYLGRSPDLTPKQVAAQMTMTSGSITALIDRLEHSGYVTRRPNVDDRRSVILGLTDSGSSVVAEVRGAYEAAFTGAFSESELAQAVSVLNTLGRSLDRP